MDIWIEPALVENANELIEVQNKAFYSDYIKYGECPGYNRTYESMKNSIENAIVFKILSNDIIIGNIIVSDKGNGHYYLGGLCVIPEYENKGVGQKAMRFIDLNFKDAKHWSLETPADKIRNHYFYQKFGYQITKEFIDEAVKIVLFERYI